MLETKYVKKLTCDACRFSKEVYCDEDTTSALFESTTDWIYIRFNRFDDMGYTYKHFCPKCAEKFLALFEKSDEEEESDNVDADGNEKRCDKCFYFSGVIGDNRGICNKYGAAVDTKCFCANFTGM